VALAQVARLRQRPDQRDHHRVWRAQWHLRQWRDPPRRRSVRLPRHSVQPWPRMRGHVSPLRRDRPHRALQDHDPRSIVPRRRSDQP
jgi:hypothetical protein